MSKSMFENGEDLPLFSRSPIRVTVSGKRKQTVGNSLSLFGCKICHGTGKVKVGKTTRRCWCNQKTYTQEVDGKEIKIFQIIGDNKKLLAICPDDVSASIVLSALRKSLG